MKKSLFILVLAFGGLILAPDLHSQTQTPVNKPSRADRKAQKEAREKQQAERVNQMISESDFVLEPNQLSGYNVNPILNFVRLMGDTVIFQTSSPTDRSRLDYPFTDKTVFARILSRKESVSPKSGYHQIDLQLMAATGISFRVVFRISPTGNASASITANNSGGRLEYSGKIVPFEDSGIWTGAESIDLYGFPWYYNRYMGDPTYR
jgi:hypothetical protein